MSDNSENTRSCPYCKEEIKVDAIKCRYCDSNIQPESPSHEGTCPYCKEEVDLEAIKCKHCLSYIGGTTVPSMNLNEEILRGHQSRFYHIPEKTEVPSSQAHTQWPLPEDAPDWYCRAFPWQCLPIGYPFPRQPRL
ncbi:zinc ribbon domain-containing protein [Halalkalicoccus sp. NIPERK01]|uniref:zinc ribbon domain-containing protein n=1 Tax=Halalkalicoccus sp. NIPERK01 TaxID=3053469 RepID=UPI0034E955C6